LVIVGFSFGGQKSIEVCATLGRQVKKLILIDPVNYHKGDIPNVYGFEIPYNILEAECMYRQAKAMPWSSYISGVQVPPNSQLTTKVKNTLYIPKSNGKDPYADHGEKVWSLDLLNSIRSAL
jgi:hypothetical protein